MVNCKKCGAPLTLDSAFCPYCGEANPEAQEHLEKLRELDEQFETASREVAAEVKKSRRGYGILVILIMLLLANLVIFMANRISYEIADKIVADKMTESEIRTQMDSFLEDGEYIKLDLFTDRFSLSYRDYGDYLKISNLASYQGRMIEAMTQYLYSPDAYGDPLVKACEAVVEYEEEYASLKKREDSELVRFHMERINTEVDGFLRNYLGLTEEDIAGIRNLNESSLLILVNERLNNEE